MQKTLTLSKGVNKDALPADLTLEYLSDANNVRFRNGAAEKVGGIAEICASLAITPYAFYLYQTATAQYVIAAGLGKVYAHNGTSWTNITRNIEPVAVSTLVDSSPGTTRTLTTTGAHSLTTGDVVTVYGCTGATADDYNEANATITVTGSTTFTYSGGSSATPAAVAGSPAYRVITSAATTDFTGAADDKWTGGVLSGVVIFNHPVDGLFYWNGSTSQKLRRFDVTTYVADAAFTFGDFFIQLGVTQSSVKYPFRVLWSDAAEPGSLPSSFDSTASNKAGLVDLDDTNGKVIDGLPLGEVAYIYKEDARVAMRFIGGNDVFDFEYMPKPTSLLARGCIANCEQGQVWVTKSMDIRIHNGPDERSLSEGVMRKYLQGDIDSTYKTRAVLRANPYTKEIWFFYPRSGSAVLNGSVFWNWESGTWGISHRSLSITAAADGLLPVGISTERRLIVGTNTPKVGNVDSGTTDLGATITATIERIGMHFDKRREKKTLHTSRLDADATSTNTASVYHGSHTHPDQAATYVSAVTFTQGTTRDMNAYANSAEHLAFKLTTTATDFALRTVELEYNEDGDY